MTYLATKLYRLGTDINELQEQQTALARKRDELILEAFKMGYGGPVIAEMAGVSVPRVYQVREESLSRGEGEAAGPLYPQSRRKPKTLIMRKKSDGNAQYEHIGVNTRSAIRGFLRKGATEQELADKYGVSVKTIQKIANKTVSV